MMPVKSLLGFLYPKKCLICRQILVTAEDFSICPKCDEQMHIILEGRNKLRKGQEDQEIRDALSVDEIEQMRIEHTLGDSPDKVISLLPYEGAYRKAILRWKYKGIRKYAQGFAQLMVQIGLFEGNVEEATQVVLIPIPLAPSRMKRRGFNQALDLAQSISEQTGIKVLDCLKRKRDTKPQAGCSREERDKNVRDSMCIVDKESIQVNKVVLIDDIYTTGSTIREAIRVLKRKSTFCNAEIYVIVIGEGKFR